MYSHLVAIYCIVRPYLSISTITLDHGVLLVVVIEDTSTEEYPGDSSAGRIALL